MPLHIHIVMLFLLLIIGVGGVIAWHNYVEDRKLVVSASQELIREIGGRTVASLAAIVQPVELVIDLLAREQIVRATSLAARIPSIPMLADALEASPALSALYVGYGNGDFFLLRPLRDDAALRGQFKATSDAAYLVQSIERDRLDAMHGTYLFLDKERRIIERRAAPYYAYDPRTRVWYEEAVATKRRVRTEPYVFFTTGDVGVTFARQSDAGGGAVLGADITLRDLSRALQRQKLTPSSELLLFTSDGIALAYDKPERMKVEAVDRASARLAKVSELGSPVLTRMLEQLNPAVPLSKFALEAGGRAWDGTVSRLLVEGEPRGIYLAALSPEDELFGEARRISLETLLIALGIMAASIPIAWLLSRLLATPLQSLQNEARAAREFDFASPSSTRSIVAEVDELATSMEAMRATIRNFLDIGATISAERNFQRLLDRILAETIAAAGGAAGAIYLTDQDERTLRRAAVQGAFAATSSLATAEIDATLLEHPVWRAAAEAKTLVAPDSAHTIIAVPLSNRERQILGVVCVASDTEAGALPRHLVSFVEALSGTAAIAIENQILLQEQKALLDSLIKLIAGAIDAKSPYTGGHCQRVPEIATMLARAACDATEGPFRDFTMTDDEWETLHTAAWLHDCGKVTTPEYVVDKATKLSTIYDRLHEVRTRFEVLKRDAEIEFWRRVADGGDRALLRAELEAKWKELDAEFRFVAECNEGGESMSPEAVDRIKRIARRPWLRTLDDRVGLSHEERVRADKVPAPSLPAFEQLLADKAEHIVAWSEKELKAAKDGRQFRVRMPAHKRNNGEIYNLSIGRGTLNDEERHAINDHVVQTIRMLSQLPFPKHLRSVPEISGGHHEKLDGTGYPRRLAGSELGVSARILAIADIFEALTARDRPYKTGRSLSQAVAIMASMSKARHIDGELFALFLTSGVYRKYAERFLESAQIDDVDVAAYVTAA
ncbi:MAG TPA: HD domain-containing phosphohydrolase [Casimicrobiaceae bacterium]|nr:HD domain-containing phosphohydrolase [Casimicrobiaceae bacterium]